MKIVIQRVSKASVTINKNKVAEINNGLLILVGIVVEDAQEDIGFLVRKITNLRIFNDENGVMNHSLLENKGAVIVVPQFTLQASTKKGNRPSYIKAAKPEIANYPFTTLVPNLGIVAYRNHQSFVMADIPGIIEGAAEGKGLGLRFLRHIERNSTLLFMVPADSDDILKEYKILLKELKKYNPELLDKDRILAISKSDMLDQELKNEISKEIPKNLIIIGGGPIGMEMAQAYSRLGANVTVLEAKNILEKDDPEAVSIAIMQLKSDGVQIKENSLVINIEKDSDSIKVITSDGSIYNGSHLLIAAGRKSNIKYLDLDKANVHHLDQNIKVDSYLKTSNKRIYAIGDVTAKWQFTHSAEYQASIIIKSAIFGLKIKQKTHHIPWTTYLDPEIAQVGLTEAQAHKEYGNKVSIVKVNYRDNDRAIAELEPIGFVKVMVFKGRPVGATIVGKQAGELIQIWCLALSNKLKMTAISSMISPYPTLGELNKRVANAYLAPIVLNNILIKWIVRFFKKF